MKVLQAQTEKLHSELNSPSLMSKVSDFVNRRTGLMLFLLCFVIPLCAAFAFFLFIASDRYISETRFIVRKIDQPSGEGAAAFLNDFGIRPANDDAYAVQDYIRSRDAITALNRSIDLRSIYRRPEADFITRYRKEGEADTDEAFFRYFRRQVEVLKDEETGITTVRVSAYRAEDAFRIADRVLRLSEDRVNKMNQRGLVDAVVSAERNLQAAAEALAKLNLELTRYRNSIQSVDPVQTAVATTDRGAVLQAELGRLRTEFRVLSARAPANPSLPALRRRISALEKEAESVQGQLTGATHSVASDIGDFDELLVRRELAERGYEIAERQLSDARENVQRQQVYIETIVQPGRPDEALEPRRSRSLATVALIGSWTFMMIYLLVSGTREHLNRH